LSIKINTRVIKKLGKQQKSRPALFVMLAVFLSAAAIAIAERSRRVSSNWC
jgi:uncharacterized membrane protein YjjP (DUF1212 family)